jgi:predicted NUDIX family phosphoesterase
MNAEAVLTVPGTVAEPLYRRPFWPGAAAVDHVLELIREHGSFVDRDRAESCPSVKQVVALALVHNEGRILRLRRARKERRPALRMRYSLLFGGHVNDTDAGSGHPVMGCLARELREELGLVPEAAPRPVGVISENTSDSGQFHLGVVFAVTHRAGSLRMPGEGPQESEFTGRAARRVSFVDWRSLSGRANRLDHWSGILLYEGAVDELVLSPVRETLPPLQLQLRLP